MTAPKLAESLNAGMSRIRRAVDELLAAVEVLESRNAELRAENLALKAERSPGPPRTSDESPHQVLGVRPGAGAAEIRAAYRERVRTLHPDSGVADATAFCRATAARDSLLKSLACE